MEENEAGELVPKKKTGPWKVVEQNSAPPPPVIVEEPEPVQQQPSTPTKAVGSYKPPAFRKDTPLAGNGALLYSVLLLV